MIELFLKNKLIKLLYIINESNAECFGFKKVEEAVYYLEKADENDYKYIKKNINKLIKLVENTQKLIEKYFDI